MTTTPSDIPVDIPDVIEAVFVAYTEPAPEPAADAVFVAYTDSPMTHAADGDE